MANTRMTTRAHRIERQDQIKAIESTVCQEIVDLVEAAGPSSVREMATLMGRRPDSLYYHVHKLEDVGLLSHVGVQGLGRRAESVYDVPGRPLRLVYDPNDRENVGSVSRVVVSMLRSANRDFRSGFRPSLAVVEGEGRNLWAARMKGWLAEEEVVELNELLQRMLQLFHGNGGAPGGGAGREGPGFGGPRRLHSFTWVLAPMDSPKADQTAVR